jgi:nucleoside-diphosphate-sugar epimerase
MKYIITGGTGYLGSEIVNYLLKKNHEVLNLDILKLDIKNSNYDYKKIDISNKFQLENSITSADVLIHNVAKVPLIKNKSEFENTNILGTRNVLDIALKKKIKKVVYISSSAVYGVLGTSPINENQQRCPAERYGETKKIGEDLCLEFREKGLNTSIIRPRTIMGGKRLGIFSMLFWWIENNKKIPTINNGNNLYQFVDINDLIEAIYLTSLYEKSEDFNIGSEKYYSIRENIEHLISYTKSSAKITNIDNNYIFKFGYYLSKFNIIPLHEYHFKAYGKEIYFDTSKAKKLLKWSPKVSNKQSFENSFNYYIQNKKKTSNNLSPHQKIMKNLILRFGTFFI